MNVKKIAKEILSVRTISKKKTKKYSNYSKEKSKQPYQN